jgi:AmmeMemoRadiSam system protein B
MIRRTTYAGTWYPTDKRDIQRFIDPTAKQYKAIAGICPHAGWVYSGKTAGLVFSSITPADHYILIGPNHRGIGAPVSVFPSGSWQTPLGPLEIDADISHAIVDNSNTADEDEIAHLEEHSLEVEVPFIKYISPDARIVPISLADYRPSTCKDLGEAIAKAVKDHNITEKTVLIASTDMSHYVSADYAKKADHYAIDEILKLNPDGLLAVVGDEEISMCGSGPVAAVLWAAKELAATKAKLLSYTNSGEVTGEYAQVVAYAGVIII